MPRTRPPQVESHDTRERLLHAAGDVFAQRGFHQATVRDICTKAHANIAAVNYHFGDKEGLYIALLKSVHEPARSQVTAALPLATTPEEQLRTFVRLLMQRMLSDGPPAWHATMMAREMVEPTGALDEVVRDMIRPMWKELCRIVAALLGKGADQTTIERCASSVIGQMLHYKHSRPVISRLLPHEVYEPRRIDAWAEHIAAFSIAGIRAMCAGGVDAASSPRRARSSRRARPQAR